MITRGASPSKYNFAAVCALRVEPGVGAPDLWTPAEATTIASLGCFVLSGVKYFNGYEKLFYHYHVADSSGIDSEGLALGDGDLTKKHLNILKKVINSNKVKVLEAWQGHLNDAKIFKGEINKIQRIHEK